MRSSICFGLASLLALAGCGDDDGGTDTGTPDTGMVDSGDGDSSPPDTGTGDGSPDTGGDGGPTTTVTLTFAAKVGDEPFACGGSYDNIGTADSTITALDFRFYVHDVRLLNDDGEVPVTIADDGMWALGGTVLLDFEDGTNGCDGGNANMNATVTGTVPEGTYYGVRFKLGVPFAQNHNVEAATQPAPLNLTSMWWNWQGGYKFLRIDGTSTGIASGWRQHIGSTGCDGSMSGGVTTCANPNVAEIELPAFDVTTQTVVADLARLLQNTDIDVNTEMTAPGCMGAFDDPDCAGTFANLGLPHMGAPAGAQTFFRVE